MTDTVAPPKTKRRKKHPLLRLNLLALVILILSGVMYVLVELTDVNETTDLLYGFARVLAVTAGAYLVITLIATTLIFRDDRRRARQVSAAETA